MLAIVLSDNIADGDFQGEWGLSIYIEYNGKNFLLDTGASDLFVQNANKLGKSIKAVDYAILSHAHYDHSDSMATFFNLNNHAPFFLRKGCKENCYSKKRIFHKYIGLLCSSKALTLAFISGKDIFLPSPLFIRRITRTRTDSKKAASILNSSGASEEHNDKA